MSFKRGDIVQHKVMGKGVVINESKDKKGDTLIEVRMEDGVPLKFYQEELESYDLIKARERRKIDEINRANEERVKNRYGL